MSTPREVVERYNYELWNERRFELADELIGEHVRRHTPQGEELQTRAEARERVETMWSSVANVEFRLLHTVTEGELCTIVYQADIRTLDGSSTGIASIEVFRVRDGRIVEVWNNAHQPGRWPEAVS